jgi:hypothetical protein
MFWNLEASELTTQNKETLKCFLIKIYIYTLPRQK